uniref:C3H1-type domain-containing protein n=1 Tax=Panagrolaimus davidi TaxID=227884 RepID=A0A914QN80_9BILA
MRTFVAQPYVPIEHPSEPDDGEYAVTRFRELETIPTDFVMEETVEQEPMEVDTLSANVSTVSPVPVPNFAIPPVSTSSIPVNNFQILSNIDVHGAGQAHPPRPVPYPMNSMYSVPPPQILRHEPQPVPPPSTEFIILEDEPSKLNASNLSNNSAIDANSFLQKLKGKGKSLDDILGKVKGSKIPVSSAPLPSSASAAASIPTNFSVPPPNFSGNMPPVLPVPPPSGEFQILNNIDIHASQAFSAPPRPSGPRMPNMPGGRQQTRPPPGSSGKICPFYLKGTCTFGNNCFNEHRQLQQKPMGGGYRAAAPQYNQNNRGGGSLRGRFNATTNKAPFNSSSQNSNTEASQGQDNFYRSRKRSDDFRGNRRRDRSPSPRRGRRRSRSNSPERYHRRHRSRSPHSHSSSPEDEYRRRRRSSPQSSRSPSRSPLPSRSPSKSPN